MNRGRQGVPETENSLTEDERTAVLTAVCRHVARTRSRLFHPREASDRWRLAAAYAGGTVAVAWTIERVSALVS